MSWQAGMLVELYATIETVSSDATVVMRSQTAGRISWRSFIEAAESAQSPSFNSPFVVVEVGRADPSDDYGDANDAYECDVQIYHLFPRVDGDGRIAESTIEATMTSWADAMRGALMSDARTTFQVIRASSSWDSSIPPNAYCLRSKIPLVAVVVQARLIGGDQ